MYINDELFKDVWFEGLTVEGKLLYIYCLIVTEDKEELSFERISFDTKINQNELDEVFDEINKYCSYDHDNKKILCEPIDELK